MLLDLGRNDVGRVAEIGTVQVTDQFFIERYSQVMHIVSNVEGKLRAGLRSARRARRRLSRPAPSRARRRCAPCRSSTSWRRRSAALYAGCVGYFSAGADMDTCIVLRTALIKDGVMYVQAGAGIVADSDPAFEQQECINKAKALFRAAEEAKRFAIDRPARAVSHSDRIEPRVIARSDSDEAIQLLVQAALDCFASLAMTIGSISPYAT